MELMRASALPKPVRQANLARSRQGVIRALHYHERGQDDLFLCLQGMVRVVVLDRETRRDVHRGHRRRQPGRDLRPGHERARLRGADRLPLLLLRHRGVRRGRPRRARRAVERPARRAPVEHAIADPLGARPRRARSPARAASSATRSLEAFPDARGADARATGTSRYPPPAGLDADLVLHAAAWTDVDGAEDDPQGAAAVNVGGVQHAAELGAPLVVWSSDYVFDGDEARRRTSSRTRPRRSSRLRPHEAARRGGGRRARRGSCAPRGSSAGRRTNFVRTMLRLGAERDEVAVVDDQRGCPTYVGHLAEATKAVLELPYGTYHVAAVGRLHLGRVRGGDLRGGGARRARPPHHHRGVRRPRAAARVLGAAQRARRAASCRTGARACAMPR